MTQTLDSRVRGNPGSLRSTKRKKKTGYRLEFILSHVEGPV